MDAPKSRTREHSTINGNISTADAQAQGLNGHDVYRFSHVIYHDDVNRDAGVVHLCFEALKAFSDTILVQHRHHLSEERQRWQRWQTAGGLANGLPWPSEQFGLARLEWINFEHLKLASGFELTLKAILLQQDYLLQEIDRKTPYKVLASEQAIRPIKREEIFLIDGYRFDGLRNYIPGLKNTSVGFGKMLEEPAYCIALGITSEKIQLINEYRELRNQIHFPGDVIDTPHLRAYSHSIESFIVEFINKEIVSRVNILVQKHQFNRPELSLLK